MLYYKLEKGRFQFRGMEAAVPGGCAIYDGAEKGRFQFRGMEGRPVLDTMALSMLLSGIDVVKVKRPDLWKPGAGRKTA